MRLAVLTGGGDVPGLNPCIKAFVTRVNAAGHEVVGIRRGWAGLLECDPDDRGERGRERPAPRLRERAHDRSHRRHDAPHVADQPGERAARRRAGVPRRHDQGRAFDFTDHVLRAIEQLGIDALAAIGGDDTLSYAPPPRRRRAGDRNPQDDGQRRPRDYYCIGFSTAVTRGVQFIHNLRTSAGSHERIAVVELFGRYSGETSLITAYLAGVDRAIISEVPFDIHHLAELMLHDKAQNPSRYANADGVGGRDGDERGARALRGSGRLRPPQARRDRPLLGEALKERTGEDIIYQQLAYLMRSGSPDSLDLMVATNYAVMAADLALEGDTGRMVSLRNGSYTTVPISATREGVKRVDVDELYDVHEYRPKVRHVLGKPMFLY